MNELYSVPTGQEVMQEVRRRKDEDEEPFRVSTNWAGRGASLRMAVSRGKDLTSQILPSHSAGCRRGQQPVPAPPGAASCTPLTLCPLTLGTLAPASCLPAG